MELATFARRYKEFYAPAFSIRLGGQDLVRDLLVPVSQVEVDLMLGTTSRFSFTITDSYVHKLGTFKTGRGADLLELIPFGAEVEVYMGYGDARSVPLAVSGVVTEVGTSFPEGGSPELTIEGFDHGFPLTIGKNSNTWPDKSDSYAVNDLASQHNLSSFIKPTDGNHALIEQNQESDWEFIKKLAGRNKYEVYLDENSKLHFAPPANDADAVVELKYGQGLLSFKPVADLSRQIARVEVYAWDHLQKKAIIGVANAGQERGLSGKSAGQRLNAFVRDAKKKPTLRLRQPAFSQAEADKRAKAALDESAEQFLTGDGECIGLPEIRPDRNVTLSGLGKLFSKTYYIQQATHKIDSGGYRTRFKVKEPGL
jgi:phage protein D